MTTDEYPSLVDLYHAEQRQQWTEAEYERLRAALAESEKRAEAMRDAHGKIVARCMDWAGHIKVRAGGVCRTDETARYVEEIRGIAGQAVSQLVPPRPGPLTNHDYGDEDDARAKGRQ